MIQKPKASHELACSALLAGLVFSLPGCGRGAGSSPVDSSGGMSAAGTAAAGTSAAATAAGSGNAGEPASTGTAGAVGNGAGASGAAASAMSQGEAGASGAGADASGVGGNAGAPGSVGGVGGVGGIGGVGGQSPTCPVCPAATPVCDTTSGACVECLDASQCGASLPVCDTRNHICANRFVGSWTFVSGTETETCSDGSPPTTTAVTGGLQVEPGASGGVAVDRSLVVDSSACVVQFTVAGDQATLVPRTCSEGIPQFGLTRNMSFISWTMSSTDGQSMTLSDSHTGALSGDPSVCTFNRAATLTRVWPPPPPNYELVSESEPNDDGAVGVAQNDLKIVTAEGPFSRDTLLAGAISPSGDDDGVAITNPSATVTRVQLTTYGAVLGACGVDTVLVLYDANLKQLAIDDNGGIGNCSSLSTSLQPGQTVYARVISYQDTGIIPSYHLGIDFQ